MTLQAPLTPGADVGAVGLTPHVGADRRRHSPIKDLPNWPLYLLYVGFPVMWVLGLGGFAQQIVAVPMLMCLLTRGSIRLPKSFAIWFLFFCWMLISSLEIHGGSRLLGFDFRASLYAGATVIFLYVYNTTAATLPISKLAVMMCIFLGFIVMCGYLALAVPYGSFSTLMQHVAPGSLASNPVVGQLVHPPFAQTAGAASLGVRPRPSAPFAYTNDWGVNYALLVPFAIVAFTTAKTTLARTLVVLLMICSMVPALYTLNRGMLLGVGVGLTYAAIRFAARGHIRGLLSIVLFAGLGFLIMSALHFGSLLTERTQQSQSVAGRTASYSADIDAVKQSPVLGYGAPSASTVDVQGANLGTQGQIWTVLYSTGFPGAIFFVGSLVIFAWKTRRPASTPLMWMHVVPIMALAMIPVYRLSATELTITMAAVAVALRDLKTSQRRSQPQRGLPPNRTKLAQP